MVREPPQREHRGIFYEFFCPTKTDKAEMNAEPTTADAVEGAIVALEQRIAEIEAKEQTEPQHAIQGYKAIISDGRVITLNSITTNAHSISRKK
jgi:hypothetical protein